MVDQHLTRLCSNLEPLRQVDGVTDGRKVEELVCAHITDHDITSCHPNAEVELVRRVGQIVMHFICPLHNFQGCPDRAQGVIDLWIGRIPQSHDSIPHEFIQCTLLLKNGMGCQGEIIIQHAEEYFRLSYFAKMRESVQVRKQDGGLLALGGNIFNMAVVGTAVSFMAYRTIRRIAGDRAWGILGGGFTAGWLSIVVAALGVALQLAASGSSRANIAVPAMGGVHALIGIGEGLITAGALAFVYASRRDLLIAGGARPVGGRAVWLGGLIVALALAAASPLASANPDGLEWVAQQQGFFNRAQAPSYQIIPDYALPGVSDAALATILAGIVGVLIVLGVALAIAYARRNRRSAEG